MTRTWRVLALGFGFGLVHSLLSVGFAFDSEALEAQLREAQSRKLTYLPQYIVGRRSDCFVYKGEDRESCLEKLAHHASEVLSCPTSEKRYKEGIAHDEIQARETFLQNGEIPVPPAVTQQFEKLLQAVEGESLRFPFEFELRAYKSTLKNAHATVGGLMYVSEGLWAGPSPLSLPEITAIIAHEVAHVVEAHGMDLNCMALEWTDADFSIHAAQSAFQDDIRSSLRFDTWSKLSQDLEYRADAGAVRILHRAGLDPHLMVQALEKLRPKSEGGFSSGSHPAFDERLAAAQKAAEGVLR